MSIQTADRLLEHIAETIELPASGYETAKRRYEDLSDWFGRQESLCAQYGPHIYPQGSFRLGTVVRPISDDAEYDLDLGCRLTTIISKATHTQKELKTLVGRDLESYRTARRIQQKMEEKHRCWRLVYADDLQFHIDTVPSIPETASGRQLIERAIELSGTSAALARNAAAFTGAITDNRLNNYAVIDPAWRVSNSEGYALWFESRMRLADSLLRERALVMNLHTVDELPAYRWKSPLQRVVQILKRHRDIMFAGNPSSQAISIIITTLAARAYDGERDAGEALRNVLSRMGTFVAEMTPRVANPVNPAEDFADKWADPQYARLKLEENFWRWLRKAQEDFGVFETTADIRVLSEQANRSMGTNFSAGTLGARIGIAGAGGLLRPPAAPSGGLGFPNKPLVPSKPAGFA
jgi:cyclic GMP-AMP synthase DncV-like protein